jgi:uncharacterized protein YheU (UPF0270 family)
LEEQGILVPYDKLSEEVLTNVMKSFIEREGTDYGAQELSEETKLNRLKKSLEQKRSYISYDPETESLSIISDKDAKSLGLL